MVATLSSCCYNFPPLAPSPNTLPISNPLSPESLATDPCSVASCLLRYSVWHFLRRGSKGFWDSRNRSASTLNTSMKVFRGREPLDHSTQKYVTPPAKELCGRARVASCQQDDGVFEFQGVTESVGPRTVNPCQTRVNIEYVFPHSYTVRCNRQDI